MPSGSIGMFVLTAPKNGIASSASRSGSRVVELDRERLRRLAVTPETELEALPSMTAAPDDVLEERRARARPCCGSAARSIAHLKFAAR